MFKGERKKDKISLSHSLVSSCDPIAPDWKISFKKGDYNLTKKWLNLYNVKIEIKNIPVFYTPYFGFSASKKRRSGLLIPEFGISDKEGFSYLQPIYIAYNPQWDLEITPQIRTKRGKGIYATFRFIDTPYSDGYFKSGIFWEKDNYIERYNLKNTKHYGAQLKYKRDFLFTSPKDEEKDALFLNLKALNDVDYFNLQKANVGYKNESIIISKINYFFNTPKNYFGIYTKYFFDTTKISNDDTMHILPTLHYHKYQTQFLKNLLYSIDFKFHHFYRRKGLNAFVGELNVPVGIYLSFYNNLINFSASENIYSFYSNYRKRENREKNRFLINNYHKFSLYTDLAKNYGNIFHVFNFDASLYIPSYKKDKGYKADFIDINPQKKRLELNYKGFFYKNEKEFLYHRIRQPIYLDGKREFGDFENEVSLKINSLASISNIIFYSVQEDYLKSVATTVRYHKDSFYAYLTHYFEDKKNNHKNSSYAKLDLKKVLSEKYKIFGKMEYDFAEKYLKEYEIGWEFQKKCWKYKLSYKEEITPILTSSGSSSIKDKVLYFKIELIPIGGFEHYFEKKGKNREKDES